MNSFLSRLREKYILAGFRWHLRSILRPLKVKVVLLHLNGLKSILVTIRTDEFAIVGIELPPEINGMQVFYRLRSGHCE
jgi:hypothetical protein